MSNGKTFTVTCTRCNATMPRREWDTHRCAGMRSLRDMPLDLLALVARRELSEADAWALVDARR